MKKTPDNEFLSAKEFLDPPKEFDTPEERLSGGKEFGQKLGSAEETEGSALHDHLKKALLLFAAGSVVCSSVILASFGSLFFGGSSPSTVPVPSIGGTTVTAPTSNGNTETSVSSGGTTGATASDITTTQTAPAASSSVIASTTEAVSGEHADSSFPVLSNLEPNGYINDTYKVLDEEYICIENNEKYDYLVFHEKEGQTLYGADGKPVKAVTVDGMRYGQSDNTLYLDNYRGGNLYVNLMGNSFTISVSGECSLDNIAVYGFFYGGSLRVTGTGSLTVNKETNYPCGLVIEGEDSQSCIMIDGGVTLEIYGSESALLVRDTTMDKAIYYLSPLKLTGGVRSEGEKSEMADDAYVYSIKDENTGEYAKYVKFSQ